MSSSIPDLSIAHRKAGGDDDIFVGGTGVCDLILRTGVLTQQWDSARHVFDGKMDLEVAPILRSGGSAVNITRALRKILPLMKMNNKIVTSVRLGQDNDNPGKQLILRDLGIHGLNDDRLVDPMFKKPYIVRTNYILENGNGDRGRGIFRGLELESDLHEGTEAEFARKIARSRLVITNSAPFPEALMQLRIARQLGVETALDYSLKDSVAVQQAEVLFQYADHVIAPHDAMLAHMLKENPEKLFNDLIEKYKVPNVIVSNSNKAVLSWSHTGMQAIAVPEVPVKSVNGAGDVRDAMYAAALADGYDPFHAIQIATYIATEYVQCASREEFEEKLSGLIIGNPLFKKPEQIAYHVPAAQEQLALMHQ